MLLFDANLSPRLGALVADRYPNSVHVGALLSLDAPDADVLEAAQQRNLAVVSKDDDFEGLALLGEPPTKVIRIRLGNCRTEAVATLLKTERERVVRFLEDQVELYSYCLDLACRAEADRIC